MSHLLQRIRHGQSVTLPAPRATSKKLWELCLRRNQQEGLDGVMVTELECRDYTVRRARRLKRFNTKYCAELIVRPRWDSGSLAYKIGDTSIRWQYVY